ncbi:hypothetical protein ACWOBE_00925 [Hutsoniella sourekii]
MEWLYSLLDLVLKVANLAMPIFIFLMVFNAALIETPMTLIDSLRKDWKYYLKMVIVNNFVVPIVLWILLKIIPIEEHYALGLLIYFFTAGGPFVLGLIEACSLPTRQGTAGLIILMFATMFIYPFQVSFIAAGASITFMAIFKVLIRTALIPLIIGLVFKQFLPGITKTILPYSRMAQKITTDIVIYGMLLGNIPNIISMISASFIGGMVIGALFVILAFFIGYLTEFNNHNITEKFTSAFMAGQRNAGIAMIVAATNFDNPKMLSFVVIFSSLAMFTIKSLVGWSRKQIAKN